MDNEDSDALEKDDRDVIIVNLSINKRKDLLKPKMIKNITFEKDLILRIEPYKLIDSNVNLFSSTSIQKVLHILQKEYSERSSDDKNFIFNFVSHQYVFKAIKDQFSEGTLISLAKSFKIIHYNVGDILIKYMWSSDYYYLILEGNVSIFAPCPFEICFKTKEQFEEYKIKNKEIIVSKNIHLYEQKDGSILAKMLLLEEAAILGPLDGFGDILLHNRRIIPGAFVAKNQIRLLGLSRNDYLPILRSYILAKANEYLKILSDIPFFCSFKATLLYRLASNIKEMYFHRNQIVYKEGDNANLIYIVKEGEFHMYKNMKVIKCNERDKIIEFDIDSKTNKIIEKKLNREIKLGESSPHKIQQKNQEAKGLHTIRVLIPYEIFGFEDSLSAHPSITPLRVTTVGCHSNKGVLFVLSNELFRDLTSQADLINKLSSNVRKGEEFIVNRVKEIFNKFPFSFPNKNQKTHSKTIPKKLTNIRTKLEYSRQSYITNKIEKAGIKITQNFMILRKSSRSLKGLEHFKPILELYKEREKNSLKIEEQNSLNKDKNKNKKLEFSESYSNSERSSKINSTRKHRNINQKFKKNPFLFTNNSKKDSLIQDDINNMVNQNFKSLKNLPTIDSQKFKNHTQTYMNGLNISSSNDANKSSLLTNKKKKDEDISIPNMFLTNYVGKFMDEINYEKKVLQHEFSGANYSSQNSIKNIINGNAFLTGMSKRISYFKNRNSKVIGKTKHNMFRIKI